MSLTHPTLPPPMPPRAGARQGAKSAGFSLCPPSSCLPWQNFMQLGSILPRRGLVGIASAVFMAVLIKYFLQSVLRMTPLPEPGLGCNVPSPSENMTACHPGEFLIEIYSSQVSHFSVS